MAVLRYFLLVQWNGIACGNAQDIDDAVKAAQAAYEGAWGKLTAAERGRLISKLALKVQDHFEELAKIEAQDTGKPMAQARADIEATARYFEFYGGAADKVHGHIIPFLNGYSVNVVHEPYGVTGHILPWNYPAQMIGRSLTASLGITFPFNILIGIPLYLALAEQLIAWGL